MLEEDTTLYQQISSNEILYSEENNENQWILGKDFLKNKEFALNNEEGELLIYCDERGYFTGELVIDYNTTLGINFSIEDWKFALILTGIILGINIIAYETKMIIEKNRNIRPNKIDNYYEN